MASKTARVITSLTLATLLVVSFLLLAPLATTDSALSRFDTDVSKEMAQVRDGSPILRTLLYGVTLVGAFEVMTAFVPFASLVVGLRRGWVAALIWIVCGLAVGLSNKYIKHYYDRPRPPAEVRDPWVYETNESFPSGHASAAMGILGLLTYLLAREAPPRRRYFILLGMGSLILCVGASRVVLCAHYVSDVLGGYLLGGFWLVLCAAAMEARRPVDPPAMRA
jgi:membrane-associated phospholipid phosphatase